MAKAILSWINSVRDITLSDLKLYYRTIVSQPAWHCHRNSLVSPVRSERQAQKSLLGRTQGKTPELTNAVIGTWYFFPTKETTRRVRWQPQVGENLSSPGCGWSFHFLSSHPQPGSVPGPVWVVKDSTPQLYPALFSLEGGCGTAFDLANDKWAKGRRSLPRGGSPDLAHYLPSSLLSSVVSAGAVEMVAAAVSILEGGRQRPELLYQRELYLGHETKPCPMVSGTEP